MKSFDPAAYGPAWTAILSTDRDRPLDAGSPVAALRHKLAGVQLDELFSPQKIADREMAELCLSAAWLLADDLDASHTISQQVETTSGSYWHGIMHRREGDFSNAKYWFRRVGHHGVYAAVGQAARELATPADPSATREKLLAQSSWDPYLFVDLCEACVRGRSVRPADTDLCRQVAQAEWEILFDACYRAAMA